MHASRLELDRDVAEADLIGITEAGRLVTGEAARLRDGDVRWVAVCEIPGLRAAEDLREVTMDYGLFRGSRAAAARLTRPDREAWAA